VLPFAPQKRSLFLPYAKPREVDIHLGVFKHFPREPDIVGTVFKRKNFDSWRARFVRSHESLLECVAPMGRFHPKRATATGDLASAEHGENGGRDGELHLTIHRDFVFI